MLSKAICKRCWNEQHPHIPWNKYDEDWWKGGFVYCEIEPIARKPITKEPHKNCRYFLEQTLYSISFDKK